MIIRKLDNPFTEEYLNLKKIIFSDEFPWCVSSNTYGNHKKDYFIHVVLKRPEYDPEYESYPQLVVSNYLNLVHKILYQIFKHNNLEVNFILRIGINLNINYGGGLACDPHVDHNFPHKNLLIYLNQSSGPTVVINSGNKTEEYFHPQEDVIIAFEGEHYHYQPNVGEKRVVLVATYI